MKVKVSKCEHCPCLEFEDGGGIFCNHPEMWKRNWQDGQLDRADAAPKWCPLREEELIVEFDQ